jgi:aminoglycoside phosphotransferase family enzyme/predicted kinase
MHESADRPNDPEPIALTPLASLETYRAWIYFRGSDAWKIKKPVRAGLLDYSTIEARRRACEDEVRLNHRFAPDVYRGLLPVTQLPSGERRIGGEGEPVDWCIHMKRLPDADRADARLERGRLGDAEIRAIAKELAVLHHRAREDATLLTPGASTQALRDLIDLKIEELAPHTEASESANVAAGTPLPPEAERAAHWQLSFLREHAALFEERTTAGRIREGHGALSLERVFVTDTGHVDMIDCLEFDARLRRADVCADVAFLATCLAADGRADLAERFLAEYAIRANDFDLYPLVDFYSSFRASMRGKAEWLYADAFRSDPRSAQERRDRARRAFLLALSAPRQALLPPIVIAMGGQVATGKSTVAAAIAMLIGAPVVSTDATRDFLLGATPDQGPHEMQWELAYAPGFGPRVYQEATRRAEAVLRSGRPVVIDGCFRAASQRGAVRALAERFGHPFLFVEAQVPFEVQRERLRERARRDRVPERVWIEIADDMRAGWEPADKLASAEHTTLDTSQPVEENVRVLRKQLPIWPDGLTG